MVHTDEHQLRNRLKTARYKRGWCWRVGGIRSKTTGKEQRREGGGGGRRWSKRLLLASLLRFWSFCSVTGGRWSGCPPRSLWVLWAPPVESLLHLFFWKNLQGVKADGEHHKPSDLHQPLASSYSAVELRPLWLCYMVDLKPHPLVPGGGPSSSAQPPRRQPRALWSAPRR